MSSEDHRLHPGPFRNKRCAPGIPRSITLLVCFMTPTVSVIHEEMEVISEREGKLKELKIPRDA